MEIKNLSRGGNNGVALKLSRLLMESINIQLVWKALILNQNELFMLIFLPNWKLVTENLFKLLLF